MKAESLIRGKVNVKDPVEVAVVYDHDGDVYTDMFMTDASGAFEYNATLPAPVIEAMV
ncbi:MAG: hypothetical protein NC411_10910 [Bacteroides sp.]|nr:hypothetical protein [Bacteroides sp.]